MTALSVSPALQTWRCSRCVCSPLSNRFVSTTSAINRGLRASKTANKSTSKKQKALSQSQDTREPKARLQGDLPRKSTAPLQSEGSTEPKARLHGRDPERPWEGRSQNLFRTHFHNRPTEGQRNHTDGDDASAALSEARIPSRLIRRHMSGGQLPSEEVRRPAFKRDPEPADDGVPLSIPYTKAASQFLYGNNVVLAALRTRRRKLYKLYVAAKYQAQKAGQNNLQRFLNLAKGLGKIPVQENTSVKLLDSMSEGRPHNGVVLEASKLPAPPVVAMGKPDPLPFDGGTWRWKIPLVLAHQSPEDAEINGTPDSFSAPSHTWRRPFVVLLDGITDPGNVGNIIRTCHFYGVDAVAVSTNTCADLSSPVLAKASSGACEAMKILSLPKCANFVFEAANAGWKIYAATAPDSIRAWQKGVKKGATSKTSIEIAKSSPLAFNPCILMLGAEGEGLRDILIKRADHHVSIVPRRRASTVPDVGVESINVSVAAGILLDAFQRPTPFNRRKSSKDGGGSPVEEDEEDGDEEITNEAQEKTEEATKEPTTGRLGW